MTPSSTFKQSKQHRTACTPEPPSIAEVVRQGFLKRPKALPPFLLYDQRGSQLFEAITELPEYYPTRTERQIFIDQAAAIVDAAVGSMSAPVSVLELGAGTASKTQILLRALATKQGRTRFAPADVSASALDLAAQRLAQEEPLIDVVPIVGNHMEALARARTWDQSLWVLFIGSSLGNYEDSEAVRLLSAVAQSLSIGDALLLGTDMIKPIEVLLPAYDDAQGVTAAFNLNLLTRINRELGAHFDTKAFRHVVRWNAEASAVELFLESRRLQRVSIDALEMVVTFEAGERIHTESSHKYTIARIDRLLGQAGLKRERTFSDAAQWFGVHLVRAEG